MSYNVPNVKFNDGRSIPQLGYGVWQVEDEVAEKVVGTALCGHRPEDRLPPHRHRRYLWQ